MPKAPRVYELYNPVTDEMVFRGTASECIEFCDGSIGGFYGCVGNGNGPYHGYRVEEIPASNEKDVFGCKEMAKAARKWDEFCEPIRIEFGIPVYRPGKETSEDESR